MFFICTTGLVDGFREQFEDELEFSGHRAIVLDVAKPIPTAPLRAGSKQALTYHATKRRS